MKIIILLLSMLFLCCVSSCNRSYREVDNINKQESIENLNKGQEYFNGYNYTKALEWFNKSAQQGNSDAQLMIGLMYLKGHGVKQNSYKASDWILKSAQHCNENAEKSWKKYKLYQY